VGFFSLRRAQKGNAGFLRSEQPQEWKDGSRRDPKGDSVRRKGGGVLLFWRREQRRWSGEGKQARVHSEERMSAWTGSQSSSRKTSTPCAGRVKKPLFWQGNWGKEPKRGHSENQRGGWKSLRGERKGETKYRGRKTNLVGESGVDFSELQRSEER